MCIAKQMTIEWQRSSRRRYPGSQNELNLYGADARRRAAIRADPRR